MFGGVDFFRWRAAQTEASKRRQLQIAEIILLNLQLQQRATDNGSSTGETTLSCNSAANRAARALQTVLCSG